MYVFSYKIKEDHNNQWFSVNPKAFNREINNKLEADKLIYRLNEMCCPLVDWQVIQTKER